MFAFEYLIGRNHRTQVYQVKVKEEYKQNFTINEFALKVSNKCRIMGGDAIMGEIECLKKINSNFITNAHCAF